MRTVLALFCRDMLASPDVIKNDVIRGNIIDIESLQNRLLKVCYVLATSTSLPRVSLFFSFFVAAAIENTNEANKVT